MTTTSAACAVFVKESAIVVAPRSAINFFIFTILRYKFISGATLVCSVMRWVLGGIGLQSANLTVTVRLQWFPDSLILQLSC